MHVVPHYLLWQLYVTGRLSLLLRCSGCGERKGPVQFSLHHRLALSGQGSVTALRYGRANYLTKLVVYEEDFWIAEGDLGPAHPLHDGVSTERACTGNLECQRGQVIMCEDSQRNCAKMPWLYTCTCKEPVLPEWLDWLVWSACQVSVTMVFLNT